MTEQISHPPLKNLNILFTDSWKGVGRKSLSNHWVVFNTTHSPQERMVITLANLSARREVLKDLDHATVRVVADALEAGLPSSSAYRAIELLGLNQARMSSILDISPSTLARRTILKSSTSERLFRISALFQKALELFEDQEEARRWFRTPKRALGGKTPLDYSETEVGAREVEDLLGRLEYGVYT